MLAGFWHKIPFVRIVIPLAIGIGINMFFPVSLITSSIIFFTLLVLLILIWQYYKYHFYDFVFGIFFNIFYFFGGILLNNAHNHLNYQSHFSYYQSNYLAVEIIEPALLKKNSIKCKALVLQAIDSLKNTDVDGELILYFEKDTQLISKLSYGTRLLIRNNCTEIKGPQNPNEFNYKRFLAFNQIYKQSYLTEKDFIVLDNNGGNLISHPLNTTQYTDC